MKWLFGRSNDLTLAVPSPPRATHPRVTVRLVQEARHCEKDPRRPALVCPIRAVTCPAHGAVRYLNGQYILIIFLISVLFVLNGIVPCLLRRKTLN